MITTNFIPAIESLIFAAPTPITIADIKYCLENTHAISIGIEEIEGCIHQITSRYQNVDFGIELKEISGGFQFLSKPEFGQ